MTDLSFKVDASFHLEYKLAALHAGMSMKQLLIESFELWCVEDTTKSDDEKTGNRWSAIYLQTVPPDDD